MSKQLLSVCVLKGEDGENLAWKRAAGSHIRQLDSLGVAHSQVARKIQVSGSQLYFLLLDEKAYMLAVT